MSRSYKNRIAGNQASQKKKQKNTVRSALDGEIALETGPRGFAIVAK